MFPAWVASHILCSCSVTITCVYFPSGLDRFASRCVHSGASETWWWEAQSAANYFTLFFLHLASGYNCSVDVRSLFQSFYSARVNVFSLSTGHLPSNSQVIYIIHPTRITMIEMSNTQSGGPQPKTGQLKNKNYSCNAEFFYARFFFLQKKTP